jgi:predicted nucleic acid-binding protein
VGSKRIVLDSGALSSFAEESRMLRTALRGAFLNPRTQLVVPTVVIAEATTGDHRRDAGVNNALKETLLLDLDVRTARSAAFLRHARRRRGAGTIDAIVVATADLIPGSEVVTTDPNDLGPLASVHGRTRIVTVADALRR